LAGFVYDHYLTGFPGPALDPDPGFAGMTGAYCHVGLDPASRGLAGFVYNHYLTGFPGPAPDPDPGFAGMTGAGSDVTSFPFRIPQSPLRSCSLAPSLPCTSAPLSLFSRNVGILSVAMVNNT